MKEIVRWNQHHGRHVVEHQGIKVMDCELCGYAHQYPLPSDDDFKEYYNEQFYEQYHYYITNDAEDSEWIALECRDKIAQCLELSGKSKLSVLDIGSGPGYFLQACRDVGCQTKGIEPARQSWEYSTQELGLDVDQAFYSADTYQSFGSYDLLHNKTVLEHLADPLEMLQLMRENLNEGGLLCITVPNEFNKFQNILHQHLEKDAWWVTPEHLNYFTTYTLSRLMERAGFEVLRSYNDFPMELFVLMGDDYLGNEPLGRACHNRRKHFELMLEQSDNSELRRSLYEAFTKAGVGRLTTCIGRKQS